MAKVLEDIIIIKLSRMVRDSDDRETAVEADQRALIEQTIPALVEEVINDTSVVVEVAEIE
jgi:hypothetical protein